MRSQNLFQDDDGNPVLQPALVFYGDIIGWRDSILEAFASGTARNFLIEKRAILRQAYEIAKLYAKGSEHFDRPWLKLKILTDNIVLGMPAVFGDEENSDLVPELSTVFDIVASLQLYLGSQGLFIRGGISKGLHYMDEDMAFGEALLEAVDQDRKGAPPRVVVTNSCNDVLLKIGSQDVEDAPFYDELLVDDHGVLFLDYLSAAFKLNDGMVFTNELRQHREFVIHGWEKATKAMNREVANKYEWLARYHNFACNELRSFGASDELEAAAIVATLNGVRELTIPGVPAGPNVRRLIGKDFRS